jgi:homoaconitase/3-isopropylmalate dehydratase large subunit
MPGVIKQAQTLYDKVFNDHVVNEAEDGTILLYIGMLFDRSTCYLFHDLNPYD